MENATMDMGMKASDIHKYIPKQFDLDALLKIKDKDLRDMLYGLIVSPRFGEEHRTTLESYGLIIDKREGTINRLINDKESE